MSAIRLIVVLLAGLAVNVSRAQTSFDSAQVLTGDWGVVTNDNSGVIPQPGTPNIAGFPPFAPLWYVWTAPKDGDVQLDTVGSVIPLIRGYISGTNVVFVTNSVANMDTVVGVYQGTDVKYLNQIAANDDLYPINSTLGYNGFLVSPDGTFNSGFIPGYYGPSHLRFTAKAGQTYYFAVDTKYQTGVISLSYAYKPSGAFRFASEDQDTATGLPLYQTSDTESQSPQGSGNVDVSSVVHTYYYYNAPGALVTVTRSAGSSGRAIVDYTTVDGSAIPNLTNAAYAVYTNITVFVQTNFTPALTDNQPGMTNDHVLSYDATTNAAGLYAVTNVTFGGDYTPVSGRLVFDDFEMSKTILVPINPNGGHLSNPYITTNLVVSRTPFRTVPLNQTGNNIFNASFGIMLTNVETDPLESGDVSAPRLDPAFSTAIIRILNTEADPWGPDLVESSNLINIQLVTDSNTPPSITATNYIYETNMVVAAAPTNNVFNFEKAYYRVPADLTDPNNSPYNFASITLYVQRNGTNTSAETIHYKVDALNNDKGSIEEYNDYFPLQPGSDYAVPLPANQNTVIRNYPLSVYDGVSENYDFDVADGDISFPSSGGAPVFYQPIHINIPVSKATKFNKDFRISLYRDAKVGNTTVPQIPGMNAQTTVTVLFNDENPPAGSVDEFYNADFTSAAEMATLPSRVPPSAGPTPGVGSPLYPGQVYSIAVLGNDEALIGGDFSTYNGTSMNGVALVQTNGQLDTSFMPSSGVSGDLSQQGNDARVNAAGVSGNKFYIGGNFTSFNNTLVGGIARVNANGSLDNSFNPGSGADGAVRALIPLDDGSVLVGGDFTHINGTERHYLARLNPDGSVASDFNPGDTLNGPVYALSAQQFNVPITLSFSNTATGTDAEQTNIYSFAPATSGTLTVNYDMLGVPDDMKIFYGDTNTIAGTGVLIYDTGSIPGPGTIVLPFGPTNGLTASAISIVMNQGGGQLGTAWDYDLSIVVNGSAASTNLPFVAGGNFTVSGQPYANIARFNSDGSLDTTFSPVTGPNGIVHALGWQTNDQIVAGGEFTAVNGLSYNHLVRFNADGSLDTTNFFVGSGADDAVFSVDLDPLAGTIYVGGAFRNFNGTHRAGFARLYANGTVDTTFMDTAYNQFAGLKKIFSDDSPAVFASALQSSDGVLIGGSFLQVGGGQADAAAANTMDEALFLPYFGSYDSFDSFLNPYQWVEPKTRDGFRNRIGFARLIGGATPGPGNIGLNQTSYSQNKSVGSSVVSLVRTNGTLGPAFVNFSVLPGTAQVGKDYSYQAAPPLYWIAWRYLANPLLSRMREDGLWGASGNSLLKDALGGTLSSADATINNLALVNVQTIANQANPGNLNAQFQLANPSLDSFYLGGQEIPLGTGLGVSSASMNFIDDTTYPGQFGFISSTYIATNSPASITLVRSNGTFGPVSMRAWATNGTAIAGQDYQGVTNRTVIFNTGITSTNYPVTIINNGSVTNVERTVNLRLSGPLGLTPGATFGISNAVLRIINPNFQGYVTLAATNFSGVSSAGVLNFTVNRVVGSKGAVSINYATTNGTAVAGTDYLGATNVLSWNSGDVSSKTVSIPLLPNQAIGGAPKLFGIRLFTNGLSAPALVGVISNATCVISNDNSYGALQFSSSAYLISEVTNNYALLTVIRTGGLAGTNYVNYATSDGSNTVAGVNYQPTNGVLMFLPGQTAQSFRAYVIPDGVADPAPTNFYFNVTLSGVVNGTLGSPTTAQVQILDTDGTQWPPGSIDTAFTPDDINGDVLALSFNSGRQILAGGNFTAVGTTAEGRVARLNTDGSLDTGFLNGKAGANAAVSAIACQTTLGDADRVLIGGAFTTVNTYTRYFVARFMTDGSVDTSFNPGAGADNVINAIAEAFMGSETNLTRNIYIGGNFVSYNGQSSPGVERLKNNGTVDYGFNVGTGADGPVYALAVYPAGSFYAGKLLVGGAFSHFNGITISNLVRLNVDGSVDTNFNASLGAGPNGPVRALAIQSDGAVLVGGSFTNFSGMLLNNFAHLNANGTVDTSFVANTTGGANGAVDAIAVQSDDRIVVAGAFTKFNGVMRNKITRLLPTGATDPTINFGLGANGDVNALLVQSWDGKIVLGGAFTEFNGTPADHIARIYGGEVSGSGAFEFSSANYQVNERGIAAAITILRTGGTAGTNSDGSGGVAVNFSTSGGTAVAGTNYIPVSTSVSFPEGEVAQTVQVPVLDDGVITPDLTVNLGLSNPTPPAVIAYPGQSTAMLTIRNDDSEVHFLSATPPAVSQNVAYGLANIDIIRSGGTNTSSTVDFYTTTNGSTAVVGTDYYPTNQTVTFNPGDVDLQVQVPIINNGLAQGNKLLNLLLTNAVNTVLASPSNATLTILPTNSAPGQLLFSATNFVATSGDGYGYLTVLRTNANNLSPQVSATYNLVAGTALPGADYIDNSPGTVTFGPGDSAPKQIAVQLPNNSNVRGTVRLSVVLSNPTGGATLTTPTNTTLTIVNTNIGFVFLNATNFVRETNGYASILVQRLGGMNGGVSVNYSSQPGTALAGTNYQPVSGTLNFVQNEVTKSILLPLIYDPLVTGDLRMTLKLSNPSVGTLLGSPSNTVVVIQDADAGISFTNSTMSVLKNIGYAVIPVVCTNTAVEPSGTDTNVIPMTVNYATADGTALAGLDYQAVSGKFYFTNGIGTNYISVPIINNSLVNGNHDFSVSLFNATAPGQVVAPSNLVVTIVNDNSGLNFSSPVYTVLKTGVAATITALRTDYTNTISSVNFATADGTAIAGTDYMATNGLLVFTNGETVKTFQVPVIANTTVQPDKTVLLQLYNPTNGFLIAPYAATLTIHDTTGSLVVPAGSAMISENLIANGIIDPGETVSLLLALRASGGTNIPNVYATLLATNGITSPSPATPVSYGALTVGGASVSRPFTFTASGTNSQQIAATLQLSNGVTNIGTAVFTYTLGTWTNQFSNTNPIVINDHAIATPYPSGIMVSNVGGTLVKSLVTLTNFYHSYTKDVEVLLVSPAGQDTLLMSHAGNASAARITLTFDDAATNTLPQSSPLVTGTNKPSAYQSTTTFP